MTENPLEKLIELVDDETLQNLDTQTKENLLKTYRIGPRAQTSLAEGLDEQTLKNLAKINPAIEKIIQQNQQKTAQIDKVRSLKQQLRQDANSASAIHTITQMLKNSTIHQHVATYLIRAIAEEPALWEQIHPDDYQMFLNQIAKSENKNGVQETAENTVALAMWLAGRTLPMETDTKNTVAELLQHHYQYIYNHNSLQVTDMTALIDLTQNSTGTLPQSWKKQNRTTPTTKDPVSALSDDNLELTILELAIIVTLIEKSKASWDNITAVINTLTENRWTIQQIKTAFEHCSWSQLNEQIGTYEELNSILTSKTDIVKLLAPILNPRYPNEKLQGNIYNVDRRNIAGAINFCYYTNQNALENLAQNFQKNHLNLYCLLVTEIDNNGLSEDTVQPFLNLPEQNPELQKTLIENYATLPEDNAVGWTVLGATINELKNNPDTQLPLQLLVKTGVQIKQLRLFTENNTYLNEAGTTIQKALKDAFELLLENKSSAQLDSANALLEASEYSKQLTAEQISQLTQQLVYQQHNLPKTQLKPKKENTKPAQQI